MVEGVPEQEGQDMGVSFLCIIVRLCNNRAKRTALRVYPERSSKQSRNEGKQVALRL